MASGSGPVVPFPNRRAGGAALAALLTARRELDPDPVVVALPRGGVPVGGRGGGRPRRPARRDHRAQAGDVPGQPELAMGAIGEGGVRILNYEVLDALRITDGQLEAVAAREQHELDRRAQRLRAGRAARAPDRSHRDPGRRRARHREHRAGRDPAWPARRERAGSSSPPRSHHGRRWSSSVTSPTRWCASRPRSRSAPSASGTSISGPRATTRSSRCSTVESTRERALGPRDHGAPGTATRRRLGRRARTPARVATVAALDARSASRS